MITLTITVANVAQILSAGYDTLQLNKSSAQTEDGTYAPVVGAFAALVSGTTSYSLTDVNGSNADWYTTTFTQGGVNPSTAGPASPGYLSDLCQSVRLLLGVDGTSLPDATIQSYAFLPAALAHVRQRISTFDTVIVAGGNPARLALAALAHYTAALLCPSMTVLIPDMLKFKDFQIQRNRQLDWNQTMQNLLTQYELLISQANGELASVTTLMPVAVVLAGPTRSGINTSGGLFPIVTPPEMQSGQPPYINDEPPPEDL